MVLEVLAHSRNMMDRLHSNLSEVVSLTHSRQKQQLGRVNGASA